MNPDYEKQLEARVQRELSALGELRAPGGLAARVMRIIEQRAAVPWYRRAWQTWPVAWRAVSLMALLAIFGGLCFGLSESLQAVRVSPTGQQAGEWLSSFVALWKAVGVLGSSLALTIRQLGMGIIVGLVLLVGVGYAVCFGLGTAYVRFAMARR